MSKKAIIVVVIVMVLAILGVVIYLISTTNKENAKEVTTSNKTQTGVSNVLANGGSTLPGIIGLFFK